MSVQVHWVRHAIGVLDDPEGPGVCGRNLEDVVPPREGEVALSEVFEGWFVPGDVHVLAFDLPVDALLALPGEVGEDYVERVGRRGSELGGGHGAGDDGGEEGGVGAEVVGGRGAGEGREGGRGGIVLEDGGGLGDEARAAEPGGGECDVEPVIRGVLVGVDGDVVALADGEEERRGGEGVDGDEVGGHDGELVVDEGHLEGVVDRGVDDAQEVALVALELDAGVGAAAVGVDVRAVEEDVV